jgi:hypothetical protein
MLIKWFHDHVGGKKNYQGCGYVPKVHLHLEDQESEGACEIERWNGHQRLKRLMLLVAASSLNKKKCKNGCIEKV